MSPKRTIEDVYTLCINIEKHVIKTNGKVAMNRWIANSALAVSCFVVGVLIYVKIN